MTWNAAEFEYWYKTVGDHTKQQRALDNLPNPHRKALREYRTFIQFATAAKLDIDPCTIQNRETPEPDIYCELSGSGRYFELGELTDESIPRDEREAQRAGLAAYGGSISQEEPLEKMVFQKCKKPYTCNDLPVDLLLHFSVGHQYPYPGFVRGWIAGNRKKIDDALNAGPFGAIWFFDCWTDTILANIEPSLNLLGENYDLQNW